MFVLNTLRATSEMTCIVSGRVGR